METIIDVNIIWLKKDTIPINFCNGKIVVTNNQVTVTSLLLDSDADVFSHSHPAAINLHADLEDFVCYSDANINGVKVKLKTNGAHVLSVRSSHRRDGMLEISWVLSYISLSFISNNKINSYLIDIPFINLTKQLGGMKASSNEIIIEKDNRKFQFAQAEDSNQTILKFEFCSEMIIDDLLMHIAFFFHTLANVYMKNLCNSERESVIIHIPTFRLDKEDLRHPELQYICIGKPNTFSTFFQNSQWPLLEKDKQIVLKQAVYTFARCKFCDNTTQFLLLYSILDRYAGNVHGKNPYSSMKEGLKRRNISISKIGPATDKELQLLHLYLIHDNGEKVDVTNFCNLRNYIMHFMATPQIDDYLKRNCLVSNMRFAVTTILLQEFGFGNFTFHSGFEHLSVSIKKQKEE